MPLALPNPIITLNRTAYWSQKSPFKRESVILHIGVCVRDLNKKEWENDEEAVTALYIYISVLY